MLLHAEVHSYYYSLRKIVCNYNMKIKYMQLPKVCVYSMWLYHQYRSIQLASKSEAVLFG